MNKINPEVFEQAAEILFGATRDAAAEPGDQFACHAISLALGDPMYGETHPGVLYFKAVLKPLDETEAGDAVTETINGSVFPYWKSGQFYGDTTPQNQEARILGLLLCAELAREGYEP